MSVRVVNLRAEPHDIYIGRPSRWGNPFRLSSNEPRGATIERYRQWLWDEIRGGRVAIAELCALDGKTLGCFCKPAPCHGDILAAAIEWALAQ